MSENITAEPFLYPEARLGLRAEQNGREAVSVREGLSDFTAHMTVPANGPCRVEIEVSQARAVGYGLSAAVFFALVLFVVQDKLAMRRLLKSDAELTAAFNRAAALAKKDRDGEA